MKWHGYSTSNSLQDPSQLLMLSNLMAEVQIYATHGNIDNISLKGTAAGIKIGNTSNCGVDDEGNTRLKWGISDYVRNYWMSNAKLVTYIACNTGGRYGIASEESLVFDTVATGCVDVCVGFKKEISYSAGAEAWASNYNNYLSLGYGVNDALDFANSISYNDNRVHSNYLVYNSSVADRNMKIGRYAETSSYNNEINSIQADYAKNISDSRKVLLNENIKYDTKSDESIYEVIRSIDQSFDKENYKISREYATITDVSTGKTDETEYIDVRLYIGDFYTNAGYKVVVRDNKIINIYDNNINIEKQKVAIENADKYCVKNNTYSTMRDNVIATIEKNGENKVSSENDIKYFFDIETGKKYLEINYENEIVNEDNTRAIAIDTIFKEI